MVGWQAYAGYRKEKESAKWAVPMLDPPYFQWRPKRGVYTCFLRCAATHHHALVRSAMATSAALASLRRSHYKMEVGCDARYLSDLMRKMLRCPTFLDSSTLSDLRTLFSHGITHSDGTVILSVVDSS